MNDPKNISEALKSGKKVTYCGDTVVATNNAWEISAFRIVLSNGASYTASYREIRSMDIE